jgi:hypothetical protein
MVLELGVEELRVADLQLIGLPAGQYTTHHEYHLRQVYLKPNLSSVDVLATFNDRRSQSKHTL